MRGLHTDLYQLTMAAGYFHVGKASDRAICELFVRRLPARRRYLMAMGLDAVLAYLERLSFTSEDIAYLKSVPALADAMSDDFVAYLERFRFTGDVWAVPEGTAVFAGEPLLRVSAPLIEAQLIETFALSTINHATMVASKAARVVHAAQGRGVMEFGSRRTHGDAAVDAARAACAVGFVGTSNVEAGRRFGIPVLGTAAHMWTMAHPTEEEAFENYVSVFPNAATLLIDTYDTHRGAERAARIAKEKLKGVRLDSGDLLELSREVRRILDEAGHPNAKIIASGDLNEYRITDLLTAGAPIDSFGVGTEVVASADAPALGGVYKVVELHRDGAVVPIAKFSEGKATYPGPHQLFRSHDENGTVRGDVLGLAHEKLSGRPLLDPVMEGGKRTARAEPLSALQARAKSELEALPPRAHQLAEGPAAIVPTLSTELSELVASVRDRVQGQG